MRTALLLGLLLLTGCSSMTNSDPVLRHVVAFRFKPDATPEDIAAVERAFVALPDKVAGVEGSERGIFDFEWGTNNSPEELNEGFTHCFLISFESEAARDAYLVDPAHEEFVKLLRPHLDKPFVMDYWAQR